MDTRLVMLCLGCALVTYSFCHLYRLVAVALLIIDQPNNDFWFYELEFNRVKE